MGAVRCVWDAHAVLGEGPFWDERAGALYWVDIKKPAVMRFVPATGETRTWPMPVEVGAIAPRARDGMVAALRTGFAFWDPETGRIDPIVNPEAERQGNRFNDGKCDEAGRFWAGTMDDSIKDATGWLYRLDADGTVERSDGGYVVTNGPAFAPDGACAYHTDTMGRTVYRFDIDAAGRLENKRVFVRFGEADGYPDGMTVDASGYVWICHWGGGRVSRFSPAGVLDRAIAIPATQVTSCAFGGPDLKTLYVTTASIGLHAAELERQPLAGGLFEIETEFAGTPVNRFKG